MKRSALVVILLLLVILIAGIILLLVGGSGPTIAIFPDNGPVSARQSVTVTVSDSSGVKEVLVSAQQGGQELPILAKKYPAGVTQAKESFTFSAANLKQGPFSVVVQARDRSIARFGAGNSSAVTRSFLYDNKPPAIAVLSIAHNIARGGVGLAVYTVNKEVQKSGVAFGDRFFPGYRQGNGNYACMFPFPYDFPTDQYVPKVLAVDRAGNERRVGIYFHLIPKGFRSDRIELPDSYLEKVAAEFKDKFPQTATPLETFLKVNRDQRLQDLKVLSELGAKTSPTPLWKGIFLRLPNSAPRGGFAQQRSYFHKGKEVDRQTHLGVDLASLPHSPVPAANSGKVVYADYLGIYGQCVIIDHGMGLQSLYGHLSQMGVKVGDQVEKGAVIGRTGDTGLAGGDHLHFGMVVSGEQVNPIEWWDENWIRNNVTGKLESP